MKSLVIAFAMYSKVPMPQVDWEKKALSWALCWFPLIGVVIGAVLWGWMALAEVLKIGPLLFGAIAVVGMGTLVRAGQDLMEPRNMVIVAVILVFGIGGMVIEVGAVSVKGIGLAGIIGVVLNLVLPKTAPPRDASGT